MERVWAPAPHPPLPKLFWKIHKSGVPDLTVTVKVEARVISRISPAQPVLRGELQKVGKAHSPVAVEVGGKGLKCRA